MAAQADIRKWFLKKPDHDKSKKSPADGNADMSSKAYQKESKYFTGGKEAAANGEKSKLKLDRKSPDGGKRKSDQGVQNSVPPEDSPQKKPRLLIPAHEASEGTKTGSGRQAGRKHGAQVDVSPLAGKETKRESETPSKAQVRGKEFSEDNEEESKPVKTTARGKGRRKAAIISDDDYSEEEEAEEMPLKTPQSGGKVRGRSSKSTTVDSPGKGVTTSAPKGRGAAIDEEDDAKPASAPGRGRGRGGGGGRGGGRGGWAGGRGPPPPRGTPPHKGEKEVPQGADDALAGLTFVISGTLDSLEREDAEVLIKTHQGRVTSGVSKKTTYLLADEDVGGVKSKKAKELGVKFLTEDELFAMIAATKPKSDSSKQTQKSPVKASVESKGIKSSTGVGSGASAVDSTDGAGKLKSIKNDKAAKSSAPLMPATTGHDTEAWPSKHQPKSTADLIGNPGIVKQLRDWLQDWDASFLHTASTGKGKRKVGGSGSSGDKKAVLLSGQPGIGKTTTARLVCKELGFETLEVNASDSRGKADSKIRAGMSGSTANTIKEMVNNEAITFGKGKTVSKTVLIMDEVDGMSGGDRGGVADLIASIKLSRVPIICICNDRFSQKLKSLQNYCLPLVYRKPTKQQMAKRLQVVAKAEGLEVDEVTLEDIAERTNGDMRMSLNQLQYMSLRTRTLKFAEVHSRLLQSSKDEDISPFSAADKLLGFDGGRLRMDQRVDLHMTDMDLVPLLVQENYLNFLPSAANQDQSGVTVMNLAARSALSIADGDIVNVQIRRRQQWQHLQTGAFLSSIIPAALMHGRRVEFEGGRNFNRFPAWLGKNSSYGKKVRLLEDVHVHLLASRLCEPTREAIRMGYVPMLALSLSYPLSHLSKEEAVEEVVEIMDKYSLTQDDYETIMDISKFKGQANLLEGVPAAVKTALTKRYKQGEQDRRVRSADLLPAMALPGQRKTTKKPARLKLEVEDDTSKKGDDGELSDGGEADDNQEEAEEESADEADKEDSLLASGGTSSVIVDFDTQKAGQRGGSAKPKAGAAKTPRKSGGPSKGAPTPGKRKR